MCQQPLGGQINIRKIYLWDRQLCLALGEAHVQQLLDDGGHLGCQAVVELVQFWFRGFESRFGVLKQ